MTSHDVVNYVRKITGIRQVGHAGTLDPFATGVLLVAIGKATRLLEYTRDFKKTYLAEFTLGATSDTDDITGQITKFKARNPKQISKSKIQSILKRFVGPIQQTPPAYSAVKIAGKKLYEYARKGDRVERHPRPVIIYSIKLIYYEYPCLKLEITCGSGTFIRSLARDVGDKLGVGSYVSHLERISIHKFHISEAKALSDLSPVFPTASLLPPERLIEHLPSITLSPADVVKWVQGRGVQTENNLSANQPIAVFDEVQALVGIGHFDLITRLLHPKKVL